SLGNVIVPNEIIDKFGAEILRLWVTYEDYRDDIKISKDIINRLIETYRRIRNTLRFLHANINEDFDPGRDAVPYDKLSSLDKWLLSRLTKLIDRVSDSYNNYTFHSFYHAVHNFCTVDLSALYLDIVKDRIYVEHKDSQKRRASQTVILEALITLVKLIAPVLSTTADEMWSYLKGYVAEESVFLAPFPIADKSMIDVALEEKWEKIWKVRELANKKIEEKRTAKEIGHSLDTKIVIFAPDDDYAHLSQLGDELKDVFIVSQIEIQKATGELDVEVLRAEGEKCERCWQYDTNIQKDGKFPNVCKRCADTLSLL
ncbi:MAG: class I tRNA ligase family protein, partial [Syntrophorhabdaceae bacterium]